jgi:catechol 2,3-dioxygenase-like lactoylglutathione lyase family enzyme
MNIRFAHTIVYVKDIEISKKFYSETLGNKILQDAGVWLLYENGLSIHQAKELNRTVYKTADYDKESQEFQGHRNVLIYFKSNEIDKCYEELKEKGIQMIHSVETQEWGQRVFRFYDPDNHIVEIGEINS